MSDEEMPPVGLCVRCGAFSAPNLLWHCRACADSLHAEARARFAAEADLCTDSPAVA